MQVSYVGLKRFLIFDFGDAGEFGLERFQPLSLNLGLVHAAGIVVADFLLAAAFGRVRVLGRSFKYLVQGFASFLVENVCYTPGWIGCGDWIGCEPTAISILIKICAGVGALVEARQIIAVPVLTENGGCPQS